VNLGECELIDEIMIGEDRLLRFSGCKVTRITIFFVFHLKLVVE